MTQTKMKRINWEQLRTDLESARGSLEDRLHGEALSDIKRKLALDLGEKEASELIPQKPFGMYHYGPKSGHLSLVTGRNIPQIYVRLPDAFSPYEYKYWEQFHD